MYCQHLYTHTKEDRYPYSIPRGRIEGGPEVEEEDRSNTASGDLSVAGIVGHVCLVDLCKVSTRAIEG